MDRPTRKSIRLKDYDYGCCGAYFITICSKDRECIFRHGVGAATGCPELSDIGRIVDWAISEIENKYNSISVDNYVIMPNHVHLLLSIKADENGRAMPAPTISTVVSQMKAAVSKKAGFPVWQKLFHDHVVRGRLDYEEIWEYIDNNPLKWKLDKLYRE